MSTPKETLNENFTKAFKTRTEFIEMNNGRTPGIWEIALDIGYSAVKSFSPIGINCFPSFARHVSPDQEFISKPPKECILYKNLDNGNMWMVGEIAQTTATRNDSMDSEETIYGRDRYYSENFRVIVDCGLGISLLSNSCGDYTGERIVVQTGLPEKYMSDEEDMRDVIAFAHNFAIKVGNRAWREFHLDIDPKDVFVMSQPKGTLFSVCTDKNGGLLQDAAKYLKSNVLVFDPGFGTLDIFSIKSGAVAQGATYPDLGMRRVLKETADEINRHYNIKKEFTQPGLQKNLETGTFCYSDRRKLTSKEYPFADILSEVSTRICDEAIARMANTMDISEYKYLIVTGGTGAAWLDHIISRFSQFTTIKILRGNQNDDLPGIYSNVRGYYMYRLTKLARTSRGR